MIVDIARLRAGHERVVADADVARPHHGEHVGGEIFAGSGGCLKVSMWCRDVGYNSLHK